MAEEHRKLAATYGYKPLPLNTINGWSSKNYIRWERLPEIYHVAAVTGVDLDIRRFIIEKVT